MRFDVNWWLGKGEKEKEKWIENVTCYLLFCFKDGERGEGSQKRTGDSSAMGVLFFLVL